ncbi:MULTISPECIES: type I-C CRISPR-associated protein Cas8c/Csd1 [unclassified Thiocapsa]|uniref:type I-C CRISPR-associated protein Cas8c/Csd1 n=1 Tax=unclassified Thiocapsa TaxID=2641286 RepID=UPI0035B0AFEE
MILQALHDYYERQRGILPGLGIESKELPFLLVLHPDGRFVQIQDTREQEGKKLRGTPFLVPQGVKKSVNVAANLLWGNVEYVLGVPDPKKLTEQRQKGKESHYRKRLKQMHAEFQAKIDELPPEILSSGGLSAVRTFLSRGDYADVLADPLWPQLIADSANVSFKIAGDETLVCSDPLVLAKADSVEAETKDTRVCLITGRSDAIERLHSPIKGVWGAHSRGADIVSFNLPSCCSFGREQGANAPIGKGAAFGYTTAINHLLGSRQRLQVGDASTVFWAERANPMESLLAQLFGEPQEDNPDEGTNAVRALFEAPKTGAAAIDDDGTRFFVLGLGPNAARIAVRFWHVATVGELAENIRRHFRDLEIIRPKYSETPFLSLKSLLSSLSPSTSKRPDGDIEKLPPNLAGDIMKAILAGAPYPRTLLQAALRRIRAEQAKKDGKTGRHRDHIPHARAALVKAWLNRHTRHANSSHEREIEMALDEQNTNIGYRLGRLFAVLERVQQDAAGGPGKVNTTIRDSYFGSASSTPSAVFPTLMRRNQHHMTKLRKEKPGLYVNRDKLIQAIYSDGIDGDLGFHTTLSLENQGRFVIGYYHQRQDLFKTAS